MRFFTYKKVCQALFLSTGMLAVTSTAVADGKNHYHFNRHHHGHHHNAKKVFNRIASFPVYLNSDVDMETVAEIVDVSKDGKTLVYTDGVAGKLGFVDIKNPTQPQPLGSIAVGGEPTSVAVAGKYALVAVNTSPDFISPSGKLLVFDIHTHSEIRSINLGGQPDSIAVSPDGRYAAVVIENERDEDLDDGQLPQNPSGFMVIVDLIGNPVNWQTRTVELAGVPALYPSDAEPEYVDINKRNVAVVTFQENNHLALIDLRRGEVINDFSAGSTDLFNIDVKEEDPALISLTGERLDRLREPDGVAWLNNRLFATADEGDLDGGSRGFTVFNRKGNVMYTSGNTLDHQAVRTGHYPDGRSKNKGNEPENVDVGRYGKNDYLFVASERSSVIFVYKVAKHGRSFELVQTLPAGIGPEGIKAIPKRNLLVAASEKDSRDDGFRSVLTIYRLEKGQADYPTIVSADRADGTPIPWAALSGLTMDLEDANTAYTIHDSFFQQSRIFKLNVGQHPAVVNDEIVLADSNGKLAAIQPDLVNADNTVNLDPEGISNSANGGFWIASEGAGTVGDASRPFASYDLLLHVDMQGVIDSVVKLPDATNALQKRFGFEGVTSVGAGDNETLFVAFQREWTNDPAGYTRIGRYDVANATWSFYYYPLDPVQSPNGGWVGLSEITALGDGEFAVIERDNQANTDARIKRVYKFSVAGLTPQSEAAAGQTPSFPVVEKALVRDLLPDLQATGGMVLEKIEGMAVTASGELLIVNDNDGVDDSNGETQLIKLNSMH